jgi:hypothetical protein
MWRYSYKEYYGHLTWVALLFYSCDNWWVSKGHLLRIMGKKKRKKGSTQFLGRVKPTQGSFTEIQDSSGSPLGVHCFRKVPVLRLYPTIF